MSDLYLIHHGVKGQKHGVRNAEWYPIAAYREHLKNSGYSRQQIDKITDKINTTNDTRLGNWSVKREIKKQTKIKNKIAEERRARNKANLEKAKNAKDAEKKEEVTNKIDEAEVKTNEDAKKKAINNGDLNYIKKHYSEFTTNELNEAINKHAAMIKIDSITADEVNKGKRKVEKLQNSLGVAQDISGKVSNIAGNTLKMYNTANTFKKILDSNSKEKK